MNGKEIRPERHAASRKRVAVALARKRERKENADSGKTLRDSMLAITGYDPEMLYVECGRCGAVIVWEEGKATDILASAGIDPLELDASCMLLTDGCPACGRKQEYGVRIFRVGPEGAPGLPPGYGNA